jgi:peroxiredoxin (alkyl hydroperoxide reductase subunit C)
MIKGLRMASKHDVALPANWPENELFGDHVIVPPASDVQTAKERLSDDTLECLDWWMCHKEKPE